VRLSVQGDFGVPRDLADGLFSTRRTFVFILQAKAARTALLQFGLLWLEVHEFSLLELRAS
jgi:hypothetical protein